MTATFTILSPVAQRRRRSTAEALKTNAMPRALANLRVGLLSNTKANVDNLFRGLEVGLRHHGVANVQLFDKGDASIPAPDSMRDEIVASSDLVVTAMAD